MRLVRNELCNLLLFASRAQVCVGPDLARFRVESVIRAHRALNRGGHRLQPRHCLIWSGLGQNEIANSRHWWSLQMSIEVSHGFCALYREDSTNRPVAINAKPSSIALMACRR